jgi:DNA-directed RNA polymerase specialized sigma24 family protein
VIDPTSWLELARIGARKAKIQPHDFDDAVGDVLVDFAANPPSEEALAVQRAYSRCIDYLRKWYGNTRTATGRYRQSVTITSDPQTVMQFCQQVDERFALIDRIDELERSGLSPLELKAIAGHVAGYSGRELAQIWGVSTAAMHGAMHRARKRMQGSPDAQT